MLKPKYMIWILPLFLLMQGLAQAAATAPEAMVKNITEQVLNILREDEEIRSGNRQKAIALIETKVAPHFDFTRMTGLAVGRAWREATPAQREALTQEFRNLLVRTYANSLTAYRDQTVSFKPSAGTKGDEVTVHSQINQPGKQAIPLDYSLAREGDEWKVFDVMVANISLVTNYRNSFAEEVNKGGLDGLLRSLRERNRRLATAPAA